MRLKRIIQIYLWQTCSFSLHKMLTDVPEWSGLLWCFYQQFSHSDGTHSLHRIPLWASVIMLNVSKSVLIKSQINLHLGWVHFQQMFIIGWTIPLNVVVLIQSECSLSVIEWRPSYANWYHVIMMSLTPPPSPIIYFSFHDNLTNTPHAFRLTEVIRQKLIKHVSLSQTPDSTRVKSVYVQWTMHLSTCAKLCQDRMDFRSDIRKHLYHHVWFPDEWISDIHTRTRGL